MDNKVNKHTDKNPGNHLELTKAALSAMQPPQTSSPDHMYLHRLTMWPRSLSVCLCEWGEDQEGPPTRTERWPDLHNYPEELGKHLHNATKSAAMIKMCTFLLKKTIGNKLYAS